MNGETLILVSLGDYFLQTSMMLCTVFHFQDIIFEKANKSFPNLTF